MSNIIPLPLLLLTGHLHFITKGLHSHQFSSVQSLSHVWLFETPWTTAHQASLSITNSWSLLKLMSFELVMQSSHLILCYPLLLSPSIFPSIMVFSNESALCIRCPKYWSFSFNISPSNEHPGQISFPNSLGTQGSSWEEVGRPIGNSYHFLCMHGTLNCIIEYGFMSSCISCEPRI